MVEKGKENGHRKILAGLRGLTIPIAHKLILSFLLISIITNIIFTITGIRLMANRIVAEAQDRIRNDLNAAREIYLGEARHINDVVRLNARRNITKDALLSGVTLSTLNDLISVRQSESLDILTLTDKSGNVVLRTNAPYNLGDNLAGDEVISKVLNTKDAVTSTAIFTVDKLEAETPLLAERAHYYLIDTPMARPETTTEVTSGMVLESAAPVLDSQQNLIGILYGGVLLNRDFALVDKIKQTVFQNVVYKGKDIGTATIFQDDVRIATNVMTVNGTRAIGTRVSEGVYNQVVLQGKPWIGRAYVVNNWYITAYEPIRNISGAVIGILYVGIIEQKYTDIRNQAELAFLLISIIVILFSIGLSYLLSRSISVPVHQLVVASKELANGNLDTTVEKNTNDEIGSLADAFNAMAYSLRERDKQLKEYTRKKFMESERLALIGQLAANVAHELNNPLQGIVTYSHLLLERNSIDDPTKQSLQKIVVQANRSRDIIRGLLDFSRQRKPDKTLCNINNLLDESLSFVENQALMHNIQIITQLDSDLPSVVIDPSQVQRVFINMIVNAAEAMNGNGKLSITTKSDPERGCIEIIISDTGTGISEENLEKIFDPFFTTKETGHGVGLGLAISYGIIKEHGGTVSIESEVGKGTTFIVRLPIITPQNGTEDGHQA
jgi:two-component system, NtrC family, sensor kinase